jgi:hypothetical protein
VFLENGVYKEYIYDDSNCNYTSNTLSWNLSNGVITLSNQMNQSDDVVVLKLSKSDLIFKTRIDIDGDDELDVFTAYLKPFTPKEIDLVSDTFYRNTEIAYRNHISYTWQAYKGNEEFVSYEIYRSSGVNCSKNNAELVETITDKNIINFIDFTPPKEERICYFLKINIKSGELGESDIQTIDTYTLEASSVNLNPPIVNNNTISLNWEKSDMLYFSHYEISYSNFPTNISGYGVQNVSVTTIYDINNTSFIDEKPPYLENPIYKINVVDIFGNRTYDNSDGFKTSWEVDYRRNEIINLNNVQSYVIHPNKPFIYFSGAESEDSRTKIHKFNYETNITEVISEKIIDTYTNLPIEYFNTTHGEEIFEPQGNVLEVYDANTLDFKYELKHSEIFSIEDFLYTSSGFWFFSNSNYVYTFSRNKEKLTLIDKKSHFTEFHSGYNHSVVEIKNNQLLLGNKKAANSILYSIDANGFLTKIKTLDIIIDQNINRNIQYNLAENYIINLEENKIYSNSDFDLISSFQQPNFAYGISNDGKEVYGSNNDLSSLSSDNDQQKKEVVFFNRLTQQVQIYSTKGYSHVIFENYQGKVISISSGMKKESLFHKINNKEDLFIEVIK